LKASIIFQNASNANRVKLNPKVSPSVLKQVIVFLLKKCPIRVLEIKMSPIFDSESKVYNMGL
jgi:hypothetical protein